MSTGVPSETVKEEAGAGGQSSPFAALDIEIANINTAPGVQLSESQKLLVGSVLNVRLTPDKKNQNYKREELKN
jgi:hypothetical protein